MAYFKWADDLVIDNGAIDQDHRQLVDLVNELHTATNLGRGQEIVSKILDALVGYTADHFQREENLMVASKFPNLANHKLGHDQFMEDIRALQNKFTAGSITVASQLSTVLRDWLSIHIRRDDKEIKIFLQKPRPAKITAPLLPDPTRQSFRGDN